MNKDIYKYMSIKSLINKNSKIKYNNDKIIVVCR